MKRSIFDEQTSKALKQWHKKAVQKKNEGKLGEVQTRTLGGSPKDSPVQSPMHARLRAGKGGSNEDTGHNNAANITASVDIAGQQQRLSPRNEKSYQYNDHDLLTGP